MSEDRRDTDFKVFSDQTKTNLEKFSTQLGRLQALENNPLKYLLKEFPFPFAMLDEDLKYLLYSSKWVENLEMEDKDLTGAPLTSSGFHISEASLLVYQKALSGAYHTDKGRDLFMTPKNKRVHIHWMVWRKKEKPGGLILIANLNSLP